VSISFGLYWNWAFGQTTRQAGLGGIKDRYVLLFTGRLNGIDSLHVEVVYLLQLGY
jgi:hypothetical protein